MERISELKVQWSLANQCNLRCDYCHPELYKGDNPFPDLKRLSKAFDNLDILSTYYDRILLEITGGEPTYSQNLQLVIARNSNPKISYQLVSNGYADVSWWAAIKHKLSQIQLTYHHGTDFDHFFDVVQELEQIFPTILIPITPDNWQKQMTVYETLKPFNYDLQLQFLYSNFTRGNNQYLNYSQEQWDYYYFTKGIVKQEEVVKTIEFKRQHNLNNFYGHMCWAGSEQVVINQLGDVYRGWCFGSRFGNIYTDHIKLFNGPMACPKTQCTNGFDLQARKSQGSWGMA